MLFTRTTTPKKYAFARLNDARSVPWEIFSIRLLLHQMYHRFEHKQVNLALALDMISQSIGQYLTDINLALMTPTESNYVADR